MNVYPTLPKKADMPTHTVTFKWGNTYIVQEKVRGIEKLVDVKYISLNGQEDFSLEKELREYITKEISQLNDILKQKLDSGEIC